jgi:hypothetical protein
VTKVPRSHRYQINPASIRTITALLTLREHVIAPIIAGVHGRKRGRKPTTWTTIDRDYEKLRIDMQDLFHDLGIMIDAPAA